MLKKLKTRDLWGYASGEGASAVAVNGVGNFGMLFYTQIMGMSPELDGLALSISVFWDAITDPLMGTISDRTATRFGRRHPYMLIGAVLLALLFLALWFIPEVFHGEKKLFVYMVVVNMLMKTAFTVFVVPYTALGFEMCKVDDDRARLQGVRFGANMILNMLFGAFGWVLFFPDKVLPDGTVIDGSKIHGNFLNMGAVIAGCGLVMMLICVFSTWRFAEKGLVRDKSETMSDHLKALLHDLKDVYSDRMVWLVFGFYGIAQFSMMVTAQVQMFTYVEYMEFSQYEKTFVHSGGMLGFMSGAFLLGSLVKRFDKKKSGYLAMVLSSAGGLGLLAVFTGGLMEPGAVPLFDLGEHPFHLSSVVFGVLQTMWWAGCGILTPLAVSMIADLSALKKLQTGEVTEGRYAAAFSFFMKAAVAAGLFVSGYILKGAGYVSGAESQAVETINRLALMTFIVGPIFMGCSFFVLRRYPLTHQVMNELRGKYGEVNDG
jgi:GPH family glycoside/pentoside/hexuronide:cation symporter